MSTGAPQYINVTSNHSLVSSVAYAASTTTQIDKEFLIPLPTYPLQTYVTLYLAGLLDNGNGGTNTIRLAFISNEYISLPVDAAKTFDGKSYNDVSKTLGVASGWYADGCTA